MDERAASPELLRERERLSRASILVVGDAKLLRRVEGRHPEPDGSRLPSDGSPVPLRLGTEHAAPGGAAALVEALGRLGAASAFVCIVGDDLAGAQLTELVGRQRHTEPWLLVDGSRCTITETEYRDGDRAVFRTVREDLSAVSLALRARMTRISTETLALTGLVVLADSGHGTLDLETSSAIIGGARAASRLAIADIGAGRALAQRYAGVDALVTAAEPGSDAEASARALRAEAEVRAAVLLDADGSIAVADKEGAARFTADTRKPASDRDAYVRRVAAFAAALATGRTVRGAAAVATALA